MEQSSKTNEPEVLMTVDSDSLLEILNTIDSILPLSYPVVFRSVDSEDEKNTVFRAGIDREHNFIWQDDGVLGNIMFLNVEIWENNRIKDLFIRYLGDEKFEILDGSFNGEFLHF